MTSSSHVSGSTALGARVRAARKARALTQGALAHRLGWNDRQTVSALEQGERGLSSDELLTLATQLDRSVTFFLDPLETEGEITCTARTAQGRPCPVTPAVQATTGHWLGLWRQYRTDVPFRVVSTLRCSPQISPLHMETLAHDIGQRGRREAEGQTLIQWVAQRFQLPVWQVPTAAAWPAGMLCQLPELDVLLVTAAPEVNTEIMVAHGLFEMLTRPLWRQVRRGPPQLQWLELAFVQGFLTGWHLEPRAALAWAGPGPYAPDLAKACHQALKQGHVSARRFARAMGLSLADCPRWFAAHQLDAPFDL